MIESLDREASKLGVTRQSVIKVWLAERLEATSATLPPKRTRARVAQESHKGSIHAVNGVALVSIGRAATGRWRDA
jgi:hypothetical protein